MHIRRLLAAGVISGAVLIGVATPAFAHAELIDSDPAKGASLAAAPEKITLTFDEPVTLGEKPIEVIGPGNATWTVGKPTIAGAVITVPVQASGPAGAYTIAYRVVSDDGDDVSGSVPFTMTAAVEPTQTTTESPTSEAAPTPTPSGADSVDEASSTDDSGVPVWVWIVAAVVVVGVGVGIALRAGRSPRT